MTDLDADVADAPEAGPASRRGRLEQAIKVAFGGAVLVFGVVFVVQRWSKISDALSQARPGWIVAAAVFAGFGQFAAALGFRAALAATSRRLPVADVARVFFVSQLGKYIPGSVWPLVAVTEMCKRYGIARRAAAIGGVLALVFSLVTAGLIGIVLVLVGASGGAAGLWWLLLLVPVGFVAIHPRVVSAAVGLLLRTARREPIDLQLTGANLRGSLGWPAVSWLLMGLQCWALVVSLGGSATASLPGAIGGFALAYAAGVLFVPAPAGAGVREAVLGVALAGIVGTSGSFNQSSVIVVVLLSRVLLAFLDFAQAGIAVLVLRYKPAEAGK